MVLKFPGDSLLQQIFLASLLQAWRWIYSQLAHHSLPFPGILLAKFDLICSSSRSVFLLSATSLINSSVSLVGKHNISFVKRINSKIHLANFSDTLIKASCPWLDEKVNHLNAYFHKIIFCSIILIWSLDFNSKTRL